MKTAPAVRRLIVNADDFGRTATINAAIIRAHREGILTSASLMVNEPGCAEAVALAQENPKLGVGLHLAVCCGRSALPSEKVPGLVNASAQFRAHPVRAGAAYFFQKSLRAQLRAEIHEQFARFRATGLALDHVNGHLHFHLHPTIFRILMEDAEALGIRHLRLTQDDFALNHRLIKGRWWYRFTHTVVFNWLAPRARPELARRGIRHTRRVYGLLQDSHVDEAFILKLLPELPEGDCELYSHPGAHGEHEMEALISPRVRAMVNEQNVQLIRYQDL
jgi:hopanoid biosynthesis associated protein HpnK